MPKAQHLEPEGSGPWRVLDSETGLKFTTFAPHFDHLKVVDEPALSSNGSFLAPETHDGTPVVDTIEGASL